ncbi:MAG TPA: YCF48-related protein [Terracidiphilus sp.]|jgi:photosystem II stability/assembly factor-like uncharacterized protein|nr:YCF48-related protein [Terracidiphilus sp.]
MHRLVLLVVLAAPSAQAQWQIQTSNTTADLRGIHSVGNGVAWASGTNGTVLRTEDGGYVWQTCAIPPGAEKLDFRGIQAFDSNTAIVMSSGKGDLSRLYKTTDGCHTWKLIFTNPDKDGFFDALYFDRGKWGWLLGDPVHGMFALFATDDSAKTWIRQINDGLKADPRTQGAFAASNTTLIGQYVAAKFVSGGIGGANFYVSWMVHNTCLDCSAEESEEYKAGKKNSWTHERVPIGNDTESSGVFSVAQKQYLPGNNEDNWIIAAVGGDYAKPDDSTATAAYSKDGGKTWTAAQTPPHGYRSSVAYDPTLKLWITVGPNGTDVSTDDGRNWRAIHPSAALHEPPDADRNWNALSLPFVAGPKGRIGKLVEAALGK